MSQIKSCDLFCTVVDNYGDIGIASRMARLLYDEQGVQVRLWVDDLQAFNRLHADLSVQMESQRWHGVEVRHWVSAFPDVTPHDLVIEAFACKLPESFERAMAARVVKPVWINLEYLTAEKWVEECHGLPSPHSNLPLTKYFFFPGFTHGTGGLLRERGLAETIRNFQANRAAQARFWEELSMPAPRSGETRISLFAYENPAIPSLLESLAHSDTPVTCLLPVGKALKPALDYLGLENANVGDCLPRGNLTLRVLPFLQQDQYDRLLWACDVNLVRGEDSFVRAQFAGRPLLWQAYVQEGDTHEKKVRAWLDCFLARLDPVLAGRVESLFMAWNRGEEMPLTTLQTLAACTTLAKGWASQLTDLPSLSESLVAFAENKV